MNKANSTVETEENGDQFKQLTCERCGHKTDAGVWLGFVYVGLECLTKDDAEDVEAAL